MFSNRTCLGSEFTSSIFHTSYHHKEDKEGHFIDIRLLGSIDVSGIVARPLQEWVDYNIYTLEWRIYTLNKLSAATHLHSRLERSWDAHDFAVVFCLWSDFQDCDQVFQGHVCGDVAQLS